MLARHLGRATQDGILRALHDPRRTNETLGLHVEVVPRRDDGLHRRVGISPIPELHDDPVERIAPVHVLDRVELVLPDHLHRTARRRAGSGRRRRSAGHRRPGGRRVARLRRRRAGRRRRRRRARRIVRMHGAERVVVRRRARLRGARDEARETSASRHAAVAERNDTSVGQADAHRFVLHRAHARTRGVRHVDAVDRQQHLHLDLHIDLDLGLRARLRVRPCSGIRIGVAVAAAVVLASVVASTVVPVAVVDRALSLVVDAVVMTLATLRVHVENLAVGQAVEVENAAHAVPALPIEVNVIVFLRRVPLDALAAGHHTEPRAVEVARAGGGAAAAAGRATVVAGTAAPVRLRLLEGLVRLIQLLLKIHDLRLQLGVEVDEDLPGDARGREDGRRAAQLLVGGRLLLAARERRAEGRAAARQVLLESGELDEERVDRGLADRVRGAERRSDGLGSRHGVGQREHTRGLVLAAGGGEAAEQAEGDGQGDGLKRMVHDAPPSACSRRTRCPTR